MAWILLIVSLLLWAWRSLCKILRSRRRAYMASLDPNMESLKLAKLAMFVEFPFLSQKALEFALFRTFAIPSISALLDSTGNFRSSDALKRYDDTALLIQEFLLNSPATLRGSLALRRLNFLHGRYRISNDDFLYTWTLFVTEPPRFAQEFGHRPWTEAEIVAAVKLWRRIGAAMGITGIPETAADIAAFQMRYEERNMRYADSNRRVGEATMALMLSWLPRPLRVPARRAAVALMDERLIRAMGFERQPLWVEKFVRFFLQFLTGTVVGLVLPPRPLAWSTERIVLGGDGDVESENDVDVLKVRKVKFQVYGGGAYPQGYRIQELGAAPPGKVAQLRCPVSRFGMGFD